MASSDARRPAAATPVLKVGLELEHVVELRDLDPEPAGNASVERGRRRVDPDHVVRGILRILVVACISVEEEVAIAAPVICANSPRCGADHRENEAEISRSITHSLLLSPRALPWLASETRVCAGCLACQKRELQQAGARCVDESLVSVD